MINCNYIFKENQIMKYMIEPLEVCDIRGYYNQNGKRGEQTGRIGLYNQGKLFGMISDMGTGREIPKLIFGFVEGKNMYLVKVPVKDLDFVPVVWALEKKSSGIKSSLGGKYEGHYAFIRGAEGILINARTAILTTNEPESIIQFDINEMKRDYRRNVEKILLCEGTGEFLFKNLEKDKWNIS
jgi:hypothetical protein